MMDRFREDPMQFVAILAMVFAASIIFIHTLPQCEIPDIIPAATQVATDIVATIEVTPSS